jgi:hypothetical protein
LLSRKKHNTCFNQISECAKQVAEQIHKNLYEYSIYHGATVQNIGTDPFICFPVRQLILPPREHKINKQVVMFKGNQ